MRLQHPKEEWDTPYAVAQVRPRLRWRTLVQLETQQPRKDGTVRFSVGPTETVGASSSHWYKILIPKFVGLFTC
jgi:hypothetical protein